MMAPESTVSFKSLMRVLFFRKEPKTPTQLNLERNSRKGAMREKKRSKQLTLEKFNLRFTLLCKKSSNRFKEVS